MFLFVILFAPFDIITLKGGEKMGIMEEMKFINAWSNSLLNICNELNQILDSWDSKFPTESNLNSDRITFGDNESLTHIVTAIFNSDWNIDKYENEFKNYHFNEEAFQLVKKLQMFTSKLENSIGNINEDLTWKPARYRILMYKLLAQRGIALSKLDNE